VRERLEGFTVKPGPRPTSFTAEMAAFPEYYERYFKEAMTGGAAVPVVNLVYTGPVRYAGLDPLKRDLANLRSALEGKPHHAAFMPAVAPSGVGGFGHYNTEEEFFHAVGQALATEYRAIVDAGLILQIDDPFLSELFADPAFTPEQRERRASIYVEAVNASLADIPAARVRYHTCYGINHGPRVHEAELGQVLGHMLRVNAGAFSFEAANPRHEHEYHLWERVKLPKDKVLIPGVITHASNIVEHPELIAERLIRYAERVGRESVCAGADCGFSSQATYRTEVHPTVIWAKFQAMREGARLATKRLWG
jgi:5-methyltetrahydropteroyltriglutamate--homocysteine methyltransferase